MYLPRRGLSFNKRSHKSSSSRLGSIAHRPRGPRLEEALRAARWWAGPQRRRPRPPGFLQLSPAALFFILHECSQFLFSFFFFFCSVRAFDSNESFYRSPLTLPQGRIPPGKQISISSKGFPATRYFTQLRGLSGASCRGKLDVPCFCFKPSRCVYVLTGEWMSKSGQNHTMDYSLALKKQ